MYVILWRNTGLECGYIRFQAEFGDHYSTGEDAVVQDDKWVTLSSPFLFIVIRSGGSNLMTATPDNWYCTGWPWATLTVLGFLYCYAHVGIEWEQMHAVNQE
ncbi:hypothetical protein Q9233_003567 [Columba guinea]|nr:hypothetical protein Q9233_003567 [Columba guinea]